LLQRRDAESIDDLEVLGAAITVDRIDPEFVAFAKESGDVFFSRKRDGFEVAKHALPGGGLHCQLMVRALPVLELSLMTAAAALFVDKACG
jgi:hypothetical protein